MHSQATAECARTLATARTILLHAADDAVKVTVPRKKHKCSVCFSLNGWNCGVVVILLWDLVWGVCGTSGILHSLELVCDAR